MLFITSLNSGSNGNCYYVGNENEAVLVDAGISCRETEKRMKRLGLSMNKVRAIFISHEHSDHIRGVPVMAKKYQLPVYITPGTLENCGFTVNPKHCIHFSEYKPIAVGGLSVTAFPKHHDASEPHSFVVSFNEIKVGVFTDIGFPCEHLIYHFKQCHAAFLESNYDEEMLENGRYPKYLKNRIRGGKGHLSNKQALDFFTKHRPSHLKWLILSHLSQENNSAELVNQLFSGHTNDVEITVASRVKETPVYVIKSGTEITGKNKILKKEQFVQASLF